MFLAGDGNQRSASIFRVATDKIKVQRLPDPPENCVDACAASIGTRVYVVPAYSNNILVFETETLSWRTIDNVIDHQRCGATLTAVDGKLYLAGGWNAGYLTSVEVLSVSDEGECRNQHQPLTMKVGRNRLATAAVGHLLCVIGGDTDSGTTSLCEAINLNTGENIDLPSLNIPRSKLAAVAFNKQIYAIAGFNGGCQSTVETLSPFSSNSWEFTASLNAPRSRQCACVYGSCVCVFSGSSTTNIEIMDLEAVEPTWNLHIAVDNIRYFCAATIQGDIPL